MIEHQEIQKALEALHQETHTQYFLKKRLISKNGEKRPHSRKIFLIQDPQKKQAVLRISDQELFPPINHTSPLFPKVFASGFFSSILPSKSTQTLYYAAEEYINTVAPFSWQPDSIHDFFDYYLYLNESVIRQSTKERLHDEIYEIIHRFLKSFTLSKRSKDYILKAAGIYISSRRKITRRMISLDLIEENVLFNGKNFYVIDQEYVALSHMPIIELFKFLYYHLAIYNHDRIVEKELAHEYAFMAMLLQNSQYNNLINQLNQKFYKENIEHFPFLMMVMYMHELMIQEENGMEITDELLVKIETLIHILLYKTAPKQLFLALSQRKVGEGRKEVDINSELIYLRESLASIQNTKFFKMWQAFTKVKSRISPK